MSKIRKRAIKVGVVIGIILALAMAINWFMTYKLEDSLRKRLRDEVSNATDGFYDFSYNELKVGLFSGELMLKGLSLFPDSATFIQAERLHQLPREYFDLHIDTLHFKGINLTWLFNYRELSFDQFIVNKPNIKIVAPNKGKVKPTIQTDSVSTESMYDKILNYFDLVQTKNIFIKKGQVEYIVEDSINAHYKLSEFKFAAYNFSIDANARRKNNLLFSENFEFSSDKPQRIYESEHLSLNMRKLRLSTIDSTVHIGGVYLQPRDKLWSERFSRVGSCVDTKVEDVLLDGIVLKRNNTANSLDVRNLTIRQPQIEYFSVTNPKIKSTNKQKREKTKNSEQNWSLYSITSPIFERISIENIDVRNAQLQYSNTEEEKTDVYTLERLDFLAKSFQVDSMSHQYNFFLYVKEFLLDASDISGKVPSKNATVDIAKLYLNSEENLLRVEDVKLGPLKDKIENSYVSGSIQELEISGLDYDEGLEADMIRIVAPQVNVSLGTGNKKQKPIENQDIKTNEIFEVIAPFISYISVKDIRISDGKASFLNKKDRHQYRLNNLDFYAKNFYFDKETSKLRDEFFRWDEYSLRFRDFDNMTPDNKYRILIKEGDFDSVSGDMLLRDLKVIPENNIAGSYISITTPYVSLLGLQERALREGKIAFKTFILDSPVIELMKDEDKETKKATEKIGSIGLLQHISFDLLTIPSPSLFYYDAVKESSLQIQAIQAHVDSFKWELNQSLKVDNLIIESPYISFVEGKTTPKTIKTNGEMNIPSSGDIDIKNLNIRKPILKIKKLDSYLDLSAESYLLRSFHWSHKEKSILQIADFDLQKPTVYFAKGEKPKTEPETNKKSLTREEFIKKIATYVDEAQLDRINIDSLNLRLAFIQPDGTKWTRRLNNTSLLVENLQANRTLKQLNIKELAFRTYDLNYAIADSFYTVRIGDLDFSNKRGELNVRKIHIDPNYPKFEFAHLHPKHKDWFNVNIDSIKLSGIDAHKLVSDSLLRAEKLSVNHTVLENFKNQKIKIQHNLMPLLYYEFQRLPLKYHIDSVNVEDFTVIYEELSGNGYSPLRLPFSHMNGRIKDFTNIQKRDGSFYTLEVDGLAMGTAPFDVQWKMPVDSINDVFYLTAEIRDMDMQDFNQLVRPMAPAYVKSGRIHRLYFDAEATTRGAMVDMEFEYDSLYLVLLKNMDSDDENKLLTRIVNRWGIENENMGSEMRVVHDSIVRNPYHSNFNYFLQIIKPPLTKSIGITEEKENLMHNIGVIIGKIKRFFGGGKKEDKKEK